MSKKQKRIFQDGEADRWFERNKWCEKEDILQDTIRELEIDKTWSIAEIGCGHGKRIIDLKNEYNCNVVGIDPSPKSIKNLKSRGVRGIVGTADRLEIENKSIDLLIYGFCLYLCDRDDLFKIACEADRVTKSNAWIAIIDFWSEHQTFNEYIHKEGIRSYKYDMQKMFTWHADYTLFNQQIKHHITRQYTDTKDEWIGIQLIRKSRNK